jgi:ribosomal protein S18 acetylase RimI-like enzyme
MRSTIGRLQRRGARAIRLMVRADNVRAIAFYRRYGFRPSGRIPDYYEDGMTALKLRRAPTC